MRISALLLLTLPLFAAKEVDPNDFEDQKGIIWRLELDVARLQATEDANSVWLKSIAGACAALAGTAVKSAMGKKGN